MVEKCDDSVNVFAAPVGMDVAVEVTGGGVGGVTKFGERCDEPPPQPASAQLVASSTNAQRVWDTRGLWSPRNRCAWIVRENRTPLCSRMWCR